MTKSKVIGIQRVDFKTNDGNRINGYNVFFYYPKDNVKGYACGKCFVSEAKFKETPVELNSEYVILYNSFGKVEGFMTVSASAK